MLDQFETENLRPESKANIVKKAFRQLCENYSLLDYEDYILDYGIDTPQELRLCLRSDNLLTLEEIGAELKQLLIFDDYTELSFDIYCDDVIDEYFTRPKQLNPKYIDNIEVEGVSSDEEVEALRQKSVKAHEDYLAKKQDKVHNFRVIDVSEDCYDWSQFDPHIYKIFKVSIPLE